MHIRDLKIGAGDRVRTGDHLLGRQRLYQLSYTRFLGKTGQVISDATGSVNIVRWTPQSGLCIFLRKSGETDEKKW